jgi:phosphatidylglycerol---prolipoprotein diacylglyceryl transferase
MIPIFFKIGSIPVTSYGCMLALGFICAYFLLEYEFRRRGIPEEFASTEILLGLIGAFIGARLFHLLDHPGSLSGTNLISLIRNMGSSWYGGLVFASAFILYAGYRRKISLTALMDASAPAIAIGYGFGRIGCFLSGDGCYGEPCSRLGLNWPAPLCMSFPNGSTPTADIVLNTPIIEAGGALITFIVLMVLRDRLKKPAALFGVFLIIHGIMRFAIEIVRINPSVGFSMSQAQWISFLIVAAGLYLIAGKALPEPVIVKEIPADKNGRKTKKRKVR